ncbi:MAG: ABC transporter transmembrane domain-containing protein, partial [Tumebacillaceae bacterium]
MSRKPLVWVIKFLFGASSASFVSMSVSSLLNAGLAAVSLVLLRDLVDGHAVSSTVLVWLAVGYLACALVLPNAFGILESLFRERVLRVSQQELTSQIIKKSASISMDRLEDPEYQNLVAMVTKADSALMVTYWQAIQEVLIAVLRMASVGVVLFTFYWAVPVVLFVSILPELFMRLRFAKVQHKLFVDQSAVERRGKYFADLLTDRESIKEVRTYAVEKYLFQKWHDQKAAYDRVEFKFDRKRQSFFGMGQFLFLSATGGSLLLMVKWVAGGQVSAGELTSAIFAVNYIANSMGSLMWNMGQMNNQKMMVDTTIRFLHDTEMEQPVVADSAGSAGAECVLQAVEAPYEITFDEVTYRYPQAEVNALERVS